MSPDEYEVFSKQDTETIERLEIQIEQLQKDKAELVEAIEQIEIVVIGTSHTCWEVCHDDIAEQLAIADKHKDGDKHNSIGVGEDNE